MHSFVLLAQAITLSTCIIAHNNALLALLVSNNFAEIKSNVFKRVSKENLHNLVYYGECAYELWLSHFHDSEIRCWWMTMFPLSGWSFWIYCCCIACILSIFFMYSLQLLSSYLVFSISAPLGRMNSSDFCMDLFRVSKPDILNIHSFLRIKSCAIL